MNRLERGLRATFTGMAANTLLAGGKFAAGILGHSHALVADAVESLTDVFSSLAVWRGLVVAAEPADEDHPYGHGKAEPIAAAGVSVLLIAVAGWIVVHALQAMSAAPMVPAPFTLIALVAVIAIKEGLFRFVDREGTSVDSPAVTADAWHHRSDVLTSLAAAVGITVALIGGKEYAIADKIAALAAAAMIIWNGWSLLRRALDELMDAAPGSKVVGRVRGIAEAVAGVEAIEQCRVRKMGYQYYVDMHVEVDPQMTVQHSHEIAHDVKNKVREQIPRVRDVLIHIEPARKAAKS
jgi:cation diffusion facilitator family transporter